jgi:hypothetical protein
MRELKRFVGLVGLSLFAWAATCAGAAERPKMVVLPLQPRPGELEKGPGLGLHFLLGNVLAHHSALEEFWFGWRVKSIFPDAEALRRYDLGAGPGPDVDRLAGTVHPSRPSPDGRI